MEASAQLQVRTLLSTYRTSFTDKPWFRYQFCYYHFMDIEPYCARVSKGVANPFVSRLRLLAPSHLTSSLKVHGCYIFDA